MGWRKLLLANRVGIIGLAVIFANLIVAVLAPWVAPHDPLQIVDMGHRLAGPSKQFLLGADEFGRDILSRIVYGTRYSLYTSVLSILIALVFGVIFGVIAGYYGKWADQIIMRLMDAIMALPGILLCIGMMAVLGPSLYNVIISLGVVFIPRFARIVRGSVLSLREKEFVEASVAMGNSDFTILSRHILPNCLAPLIVTSTTSLAYVILAEAALSFLGLGTPPPAPSWGNMLSEARDFMLENSWMAFFPGAAISILVLGFNLFGDALRDLLDPRLK